MGPYLRRSSELASIGLFPAASSFQRCFYVRQLGWDREPPTLTGREDEVRLTAGTGELACRYGRYSYRKIAEFLRTITGRSMTNSLSAPDRPLSIGLQKSASLSAPKIDPSVARFVSEGRRSPT